MSLNPVGEEILRLAEAEGLAAHRVNQRLIAISHRGEDWPVIVNAEMSAGDTPCDLAKQRIKAARLALLNKSRPECGLA